MSIELFVDKVTGIDIAVTPREGKKLGETIVALILNGKVPITLNFEGIRSVSPSFLEGIIEVLIENGIQEYEISNVICITGKRSEGRQLLFDHAVQWLYDYKRRPEFYEKLWKECDEE